MEFACCGDLRSFGPIYLRARKVCMQVKTVTASLQRCRLYTCELSLLVVHHCQALLWTLSRWVAPSQLPSEEPPHNQLFPLDQLPPMPFKGRPFYHHLPPPPVLYQGLLVRCARSVRVCDPSCDSFPIYYCQVLCIIVARRDPYGAPALQRAS